MCLVFAFFLMKSEPRQVLVKTPSASGKYPGVGWRCKVFIYVNHDLEDDEKAMIYFARNPLTQEILVNFYARGSKSDWHSGVLSEGLDKSMFFKFHCKGDEQDLKNPCS